MGWGEKRKSIRELTSKQRQHIESTKQIGDVLFWEVYEESLFPACYQLYSLNNAKAGVRSTLQNTDHESSFTKKKKPLKTTQNRISHASCLLLINILDPYYDSFSPDVSTERIKELIEQEF